MDRSPSSSSVSPDSTTGGSSYPGEDIRLKPSSSWEAALWRCLVCSHRPSIRPEKWLRHMSVHMAPSVNTKPIPEKDFMDYYHYLTLAISDAARYNVHPKDVMEVIKHFGKYVLWGRSILPQPPTENANDVAIPCSNAMTVLQTPAQVGIPAIQKTSSSEKVKCKSLPSGGTSDSVLEAESCGGQYHFTKIMEDAMNRNEDSPLGVAVVVEPVHVEQENATSTVASSAKIDDVDVESSGGNVAQISPRNGVADGVALRKNQKRKHSPTRTRESGLITLAKRTTKMFGSTLASDSDGSFQPVGTNNCVSSASASDHTATGVESILRPYDNDFIERAVNQNSKITREDFEKCFLEQTFMETLGLEKQQVLQIMDSKEVQIVSFPTGQTFCVQASGENDTTSDMYCFAKAQLRGYYVDSISHGYLTFQCFLCKLEMDDREKMLLHVVRHVLGSLSDSDGLQHWEGFHDDGPVEMNDDAMSIHSSSSADSRATWVQTCPGSSSSDHIRTEEKTTQQRVQKYRYHCNAFAMFKAAQRKLFPSYDHGVREAHLRWSQVSKEDKEFWAQQAELRTKLVIEMLAARGRINLSGMKQKEKKELLTQVYERMGASTVWPAAADQDVPFLSSTTLWTPPEAPKRSYLKSLRRFHSIRRTTRKAVGARQNWHRHKFNFSLMKGWRKWRKHIGTFEEFRNIKAMAIRMKEPSADAAKIKRLTVTRWKLGMSAEWRDFRNTWLK